jgi:hypothetical protein
MSIPGEKELRVKKISLKNEYLAVKREEALLADAFRCRKKSRDGAYVHSWH